MMNARQSEFPSYPSINLAALGVLGLRMIRRKKSFRRDARIYTSHLRPPVRYLGLENIPARGPYQIHINHYARPGFNTAWIALSVSAVQPAEVTWVVADQWVFEGNPVRFLLRPAMRYILASIRQVYGFLPMPTMVPGYSDMPERSAAVRRVIRYCRNHPMAIIGLTPEGQDSPQHGVHLAPTGAGKFILQLNRMKLPILPAAMVEKDGCLTVKFGLVFDLPAEIDVPRSQVDKTIRVIVRDQLLELYNSIA
jgi:1-acyl-sn-glycerol-3-phosphate acyltransferase